MDRLRSARSRTTASTDASALVDRALLLGRGGGTRRRSPSLRSVSVRRLPAVQGLLDRLPWRPRRSRRHGRPAPCGPRSPRQVQANVSRTSVEPTGRRLSPIRRSRLACVGGSALRMVGRRLRWTASPADERSGRRANSKIDRRNPVGRLRAATPSELGDVVDKRWRVWRRGARRVEGGSRAPERDNCNERQPRVLNSRCRLSQ